MAAQDGPQFYKYLWFFVITVTNSPISGETEPFKAAMLIPHHVVNDSK